MLFYSYFYFSLIQLVYPMKNRSRLEIKARIIETIGEKGAIQAKIMYNVYLSFLQMKKYLHSLETKNLIIYDADIRVYMLTDKGKRFLSLYSKMTESVTIIK